MVKKLELKKIRTKLKNIIPSIWIESWNCKPISVSKKRPRQKIRNPNNEDQIKEYNIW